MKDQPRFIMHSDGIMEQIIEPCEDCISRAEAIKALEYNLSVEADGGLDKYRTVIKDLLNAIYNTQKKAIEDLPSVQPISANEKGIYNKGWKDGAEATAYHVELCEEENPTIPLSVIEDIKAEIEQKIRESEEEFKKDGTMAHDLKSFAYLRGITKAKEIINKHITDMREVQK